MQVQVCNLNLNLFIFLQNVLVQVANLNPQKLNEDNGIYGIL